MSLRVRFFVALILFIASQFLPVYVNFGTNFYGWYISMGAILGVVLGAVQLWHGTRKPLHRSDSPIGYADTEEVIFSACWLLANLLIVAALIAGVSGAHRKSRMMGIVALACGLVCAGLWSLKFDILKPSIGLATWLGSMSLLVFRRLPPPQPTSALE